MGYFGRDFFQKPTTPITTAVFFMAYVHDEYITSFLGVSVWPYYYDECPYGRVIQQWKSLKFHEMLFTGQLQQN